MNCCMFGLSCILGASAVQGKCIAVSKVPNVVKNVCTVR